MLHSNIISHRILDLVFRHLPQENRIQAGIAFGIGKDGYGKFGLLIPSL